MSLASPFSKNAVSGNMASHPFILSFGASKCSMSQQKLLSNPPNCLYLFAVSRIFFYFIILIGQTLRVSGGNGASLSPFNCACWFFWSLWGAIYYKQTSHLQEKWPLALWISNIFSSFLWSAGLKLSPFSLILFGPLLFWYDWFSSFSVDSVLMICRTGDDVIDLAPSRGVLFWFIVSYLSFIDSRHSA